MQSNMMTRAVCALIALMAFGCGDMPHEQIEAGLAPLFIFDEPVDLDPALEIAPPEGAILQESDEKLFKYSQYGKEQGAGMRCIPPWEGGKCAMPDTKTRTYQVLAHDADGCYGQYWTDLIQQSINAMNSFHNQFDTGYSYVPYVDTPNQYPDLIVWCDADFAQGTNVMGAFIPGSFWCQFDPSGDLCRYTEGLLKLAGNNLTWLCQGAGASTAQCHKQIANTVRHELGHEAGLGHSHIGAAPGVLMARGFTSELSNPLWNQLLQLTVSGQNNESSLIWGYCPNGNTASCL